MRVNVRVDASSAIGTGHLRRSLALALALCAQGDEVRFITRDLGFDAGAMIRAAGIAPPLLLPAPDDSPFAPDPAIAHASWAGVTTARDIKETVKIARPFRADWMVVDSYAFGAAWHQGVREALDCRIAAIDDLADRGMDCDLLIDHTFTPDHRAKYDGLLASKTSVLGGPAYGLLGPAFAKAPRCAFCEKVRSVGVFMGGVDAGGHSALALDALDAAGFCGPVEVASTSANPSLGALHDRVRARPLTTLTLDQPDLAGFFARHDLQIGAGGGASLERCCIGVPTLLVIVADNQNAVAPHLAAAGIVALATEPGVDAMAASLVDLIADAPRRRALAERSRALVDGHGAARVARRMRERHHD